MDEHEFWRTVFSVFGGLLETDLGHVPEVDAAVARGGGEDGLVGWRPGELENFFGVGFEGVELELEVAEVPEGDGLSA